MVVGIDLSKPRHQRRRKHLETEVMARIDARSSCTGPGRVSCFSVRGTASRTLPSSVPARRILDLSPSDQLQAFSSSDTAPADTQTLARCIPVEQTVLRSMMSIKDRPYSADLICSSYERRVGSCKPQGLDSGIWRQQRTSLQSTDGARCHVSYHSARYARRSTTTGRVSRVLGLRVSPSLTYTPERIMRFTAVA